MRWFGFAVGRLAAIAILAGVVALVARPAPTPAQAQEPIASTFTSSFSYVVPPGSGGLTVELVAGGGGGGGGSAGGGGGGGAGGRALVALSVPAGTTCTGMVGIGGRSGSGGAAIAVGGGAGEESSIDCGFGNRVTVGGGSGGIQADGLRGGLGGLGAPGGASGGRGSDAQCSPFGTGAAGRGGAGGGAGAGAGGSGGDGNCGSPGGGSGGAGAGGLVVVTPVTSDVTSPTTTLTASGTLGTNGWYTDIPVVAVSAADAGGSGVARTLCAMDPGAVPTGYADLLAAASPGSCPQIAVDGTHTFYAASVDAAGNQEAPAASLAVKVDATNPTVTYRGNAGAYTVDETVAISCNADDSGPGASGLASTTCEDLSGPAYSFGLGEHTARATATDVAGNSGEQVTSFTVSVSPGALCILTRRFVQASSRYELLTPAQKRAIDALTLAACRNIDPVVAGASATRKPELIRAYRAAVDGLAAAGWLTSSQADTLKDLATGL